MKRFTGLLFVLLALLPASTQAQWLHYPTPGIPRTRDGGANLKAAAPRAANGRPDLSGLWQIQPTPIDEITRMFGPSVDKLSVPGDDIHSFSKYVFSIFADLKPEDAPTRPETAKITEAHLASFGRENPTTRCLFGGVPFSGVLPFPNKFIQTPGVIVVLQKADGSVRQIFTDDRKHTPDPQPTWMGYSVGKWEGDSLLVDTLGFNDQGWLDGSGHPHSEALHVEERYRRRDFGHMDVQITLDDPKMYTKPFSIKYTLALVPDSDVAEYACAENEKDFSHMGKP